MSYQKLLINEYVGKLVTAEEDVDTWVELDYRNYLPEEVGSNDDEFNECENWHITTGIHFSIDDSGRIESIEITADVSSFGDSGLGDCDPEEEWTDKDLALAREFFNSITS